MAHEYASSGHRLKGPRYGSRADTELQGYLPVGR